MGSLGRRLERLEASASPTPAKLEESEARRVVEDYLNYLAIYRGELREEDLSPEERARLEESCRRADEAFSELVDEWRRLGIWEA